jgi:hypothetical protein
LLTQAHSNYNDSTAESAAWGAAPTKGELLMAVNPLPKSMRVRLAELGQRVHRQHLVVGLCRAIVMVLLAACVAILFDAVVELPRWCRGTLLAGWLILSACEVRRFIRGPLSRPLDAQGLAAAIEQEYPRLGERLTTAVELAGTSDPANGAPFLVDMLMRDAETRTGKLDLNRAAPASTAVIIAGASVVVVSLIALAGARSPDQVRRFVAPWYAPTIEASYQIKVTSGDPTVRRGESTTLTAVVELAKPTAAPPSAATLVIRTSAGLERAPMEFDAVKREAYLTRRALEAGFEYQIVAGDAHSAWHRVTVVDPVRLESARVIVVPPEYARRPEEEPVVLDGLSEVTALQHAKVTLELRFNRAPSSAWLEWRPMHDGLARKAPAQRINISVNADATAVVTAPAVANGEYRMYAEADKLKTSFREMPIRVVIDAPPKFEKVAGLTAQPRAVRPEEPASIECAVSDDVAVSRVELEVRSNGGPVRIVELPMRSPSAGQAQVDYALDLTQFAKEGDRVECRLAAYDNRRVPTAGLQPQKTYWPADGKWTELKLDSLAAPLKQQEFAAQQKEIADRLSAVLQALKSQQRSVYRLKIDTQNRNVLKLDEADKLEEVRWQAVDAAETLDELAHDASLTADLAPLGEGARDVAERELRPAAAALRQAQREQKAAPRTKSLEAADAALERAIVKVEKLLQLNDRLAELRLDRHKLDSLAAQQKKLADEAAKASPENLAQLKEKQEALEERLRQLRQESDTLRKALGALRQRQLDQAATGARSLEQSINELTRGMKNTDERQRENQLADLIAQQAELARRASELAQQTSMAARNAPLSPLQSQELSKALEALKTGNLADAVEQQQKAAFELDRLANELEKVVARARDPREAARQLERLQQDLRQRVADATTETPLERLPLERRRAFEKQQQAIERAAKKLSVPPDDAAAAASRQGAVDDAAAALQALTKAEAGNADEHMRKAQEALSRLVEQLPSQEKRLAKSRLDVAKLRQEQDAIAASVDRAVRPLEKLDPSATQQELVRKTADLARRQSQAADRLRQFDLPGHEERQARAEAALREAVNDLEAGRTQDVSASQQAARRELERLEQVLAGQSPADEQADRLVKKQKDLAEQMKRNAQKPSARRTQELQQLQAEIAADLQKLPSAEAPAAKDDALVLARKAENAKSAEEGAAFANEAAQALQRLADQINGRNNEGEKAERLARKQKKSANEAERLVRKKESFADLRKQAQQMLDEARHLRAGADAQKEKQSALEALNRAQQANQPEQAARAQKDAAESLQRLTDKLQAQQPAPRLGPRLDADDGLEGMPSPAQVAEARRLAEQQRNLSDELARSNEQMAKDGPLGNNPLEEIIDDQRAIVQGAEALAKKTAEKPERQLAESAAAAAARTSGHLLYGEVLPATEAAREALRTFEQWREAALAERRQGADDLACRELAVIKKLEELENRSRAARAQQQARQRQLQDDARQLSQRLERLTKELHQENPNGGGSVEEAAMRARQAEESLQAAREQSGRNEREMARQSQDKAADALRQAAQNLEKSAAKMPATPKSNGPSAGDSVEMAQERMMQARERLEGRQAGGAEDAMRQAADALSQAARQMGRAGAAGPTTGAQSGVNDGSGAHPADQRPGPALDGKYSGKSWGELSGEIKNQIISDLKARYGEEYAKYIKLYFEQLAERK